jgi:hypothetical protein
MSALAGRELELSTQLGHPAPQIRRQIPDTERSLTWGDTEELLPGIAS